MAFDKYFESVFWLSFELCFCGFVWLFVWNIVWYFTRFQDDSEMIFEIIFQKDLEKKCIRFAKIFENDFRTLEGPRGRSFWPTD